MTHLHWKKISFYCLNFYSEFWFNKIQVILIGSNRYHCVKNLECLYVGTFSYNILQKQTRKKVLFEQIVAVYIFLLT